MNLKDNMLANWHMDAINHMCKTTVYVATLVWLVFMLLGCVGIIFSALCPKNSEPQRSTSESYP